MSNSPILEPVQSEALDIQHDTEPEKDHGPAKRIPHLGHALLFLSLLFVSVTFFVAVASSAAHITTVQSAKEHPGVELFAQALGYLLALLVAAWLFPRLWAKSFLQGIQWNVLAAHRRWFWIVPGAVALSVAAQLSAHLFPAPPDNAIAELMRTAHSAWLVTVFGVLIAPLTEEMTFRGFLLPALATAYDWLALERTPAGLQHWQNSAGHTRSAVVFAAIFSSVPFALMHAGQLSHAWGFVGVLYLVSLLLSYVRIKTHSVACSTLMHATYNLTVFAVAFFATGGYRHLDKLNS